MRGFLVAIALFLSVFGAFKGWDAYQFVNSAVRIEGRVYAVEPLAGPPKPRQKIPVHVEYELNGRTERGETRMPMLGKLSVGDTVPLWVAPSDPARPVLAQPSAIFAGPLTYLVVGLLGLLLTLMYRAQK
jgi:hypothetical protein